MRTLVLSTLLFVPLAAQDNVDLGTVDRIKTEAFDRSKVMDHLYYLTDVYGPRLTASQEYNEAAKWAMDRLKQYGLVNVHTEAWPFGRSWSAKQYSVELMEPRYQQLTAAPLAWSSSTDGPVTGELVIAPLKVSFAEGPQKMEQALKEFESKWAGKLRGRIVLLSDEKTPSEQDKPQLRRLTETDLAAMAKAPDPSTKLAAKDLENLEWPEDPQERMKLFSRIPMSAMDKLYDKFEELSARRGEILAREGVTAVLLRDDRAHEGMVFAESAGPWKAGRTLAPPTFVLTAEQFNRVARLVAKKSPVHLKVNLRAAISERDNDGTNIIGEIPGTGPHKDEVVMIGAHFDSWHSGTGATDNGAGSAVMIEVMRILKALDLKLDRTVRIGLWGGEEQGLLGSRAYVKAHYGDPSTMKLTSEQAKLSGYFNLDNGSGRIRGVYLQGNDAMRPLFEKWLAPFRDLGATTISIRDTGGTDHLSFDAVGLPGFQFIQDPLDYGSITHHSSMDTYDHAIPADLMQASAIIATVVYNAANREQMLPRRPRPATD
jgi:carboxypeptidase Q